MKYHTIFKLFSLTILFFFFYFKTGPLRPQNLQANATGDRWVRFQWVPPASSCICNYTLTLVPQGGSSIVIQPIAYSATTFLLCDLTPETNYTVTLVARNINGISKFFLKPFFFLFI